MNKRLMLGLMMALLLLGNARGSDSADMRGQEWKGAGLGGLVGGVVAGPPGVILGLAGGALFARHDALEETLRRTDDELEQSQSQLSRAQLEQKKLEKQVARHSEIRVNRLQAIVDGFSSNIHFRTESALLEPRYQRQLEQLATSLRAFPELNIHIDAFADIRGSESFNRDLTERRALVIQRRLVAQGINSVRIHREPQGEAQAEYLLRDGEGLGFDRRVLLYFSLDKP